MPLYGYRCPDCDRTFDERRDVGARDGARCPGCGAPAIRLLASVSALGRAAEPPAACGPGTCSSRQAAGLPCSMA